MYRELSSVLCDDREGGIGGGRGVQDGGDVCILRADSHCPTAETNTALLSNYSPIQI